MESCLLRNDIVIFMNDQLELDVILLRKKDIKLEIKGNPSKHRTNFKNILIDDITINSIPLFDIITEKQINEYIFKNLIILKYVTI